ncbi:unnamed protein product [Fraxinus pennsylvanica]|uniref:Uncharacterized protein n=1 Tax=Fraxinus pennsylvanica TaxID=56036 RepID=A0AAD2EAZ2_9LAMI|nr:unnamed protein product [Fraxinus pennsylvanica]
MGSEANNSSLSPAASTMASPSGKRSRDPENDVYFDNLHSHKRYLSEIMASSLNGLTVGDSLSENLMDSPERDEMYSPLYEDSDDSRYYETSTNTCSSQPESLPTRPVSPYRCQKPGFSLGPASTSYPSQQRQRGSDTEGHFPSSPSDICHSADLRRAALLRSVQMRAQPLGSSQYESPHETGHHMEVEEQPCSDTKAIIDERECRIVKCEHDENLDLKGDESTN